MEMDNFTKKNRKAYFKTEPRLITQILGSEIIESHSIAFAEQIKNSKDAGARTVIIDLSKINNGKITIQDDGKGMTPEEIEEDWFLLGNRNKELDHTYSGGKGIGRLSLFKIGKRIQIKTVKDGELSIFNVSEKELMEQESDNFATDIISEKTFANSGTEILISEIDQELSLEDVEIELENLKSLDNDLDLKIIFPYEFKETDFLSPSDIEDVVPFVASIDIDFDSIRSVEDIKYSFKAQMQNKIIYENTNFLSKIEKELLKLLMANPENLAIGKLTFILKNFFFKTGAVTKYIPNTVNNKDIKKSFLKVYQGINIYRNGFKIYGHGSEDWLKLAENRVARSGENIDNKTTFGMIYLDDEKSLQLKEKSSREGFIRNSSSKAFKELIMLIVRQFGLDSATSKKIIAKEVKKLEQIANEADASNKANDKEGKEDGEEKKSSSSTSPSSSDLTSHGKGEESVSILKCKEKRINEREKFLLKNPELINETFLEKITFSPIQDLLVEDGIVTSDNKAGEYKIKFDFEGQIEYFNLIILERKVTGKIPKEKFFEDSSRFYGEIDLSNANRLIEQLKGLKYDEKYLLYMVSFRTILEDLVKEYISKRPSLELGANLKENVVLVIKDLLQVVEINKKDSYVKEKRKIHEKFKGRNPLKNFLSTIKTDFECHDYDKYLNDLTHNPIKQEVTWALKMANDIILPLYVLINCLKEKKII